MLPRILIDVDLIARDIGRHLAMRGPCSLSLPLEFGGHAREELLMIVCPSDIALIVELDGGEHFAPQVLIGSGLWLAELLLRVLSRGGNKAID